MKHQQLTSCTKVWTAQSNFSTFSDYHFSQEGSVHAVWAPLSVTHHLIHPKDVWIWFFFIHDAGLVPINCTFTSIKMFILQGPQADIDLPVLRKGNNSSLRYAHYPPKKGLVHAKLADLPKKNLYSKVHLLRHVHMHIVLYLPLAVAPVWCGFCYDWFLHLLIISGFCFSLVQERIRFVGSW